MNLKQSNTMIVRPQLIDALFLARFVWTGLREKVAYGHLLKQKFEAFAIECF